MKRTETKALPLKKAGTGIDFLKTAAASENGGIKERRPVFVRRIFDAVFLLGFLCCLVPGPLPALTPYASVLLVVCAAVCFFDENFYLYAALFLYMRYRMLIGDTPAFRIYSYLVVIRFLLNLPKTKFRAVYFPALLVFLLHSVFAMPRLTSLRIGLNVIVDCAIIYIILLKVLEDERLFRKFIYAFLLGGATSGVYGWTNTEVSVDINVAGAGAQTVNRNFGALGDSNFAGLFYSLCIVCSAVVGGLPKWLRAAAVLLFGVMLIQTASISALLILAALAVLYIILKYRLKSVVILAAAAAVAAAAAAIVLSVPQLRNLDSVAGLIIRINEKLSYIPRGRWDLLTTDRYDIWGDAMRIFFSGNAAEQLIGGRVITVMAIDESVLPIACHNSYIQSLLNFGVIGTAMIYLPLFGIFAYRLIRHFSHSGGYEAEDIKILQMVFNFAFIVFGFTVDFFIDWPFMMFYFI